MSGHLSNIRASCKIKTGRVFFVLRWAGSRLEWDFPKAIPNGEDPADEAYAAGSTDAIRASVSRRSVPSPARRIGTHDREATAGGRGVGYGPCGGFHREFLRWCGATSNPSPGHGTSLCGPGDL